MFRCGCGLVPSVSAQTCVGPFVTEDAYVLLVNCRCGSTRAAVMWQCEDFAAAELEEDAAAIQYAREEAPYDRAVHRGFFALAEELAVRGW